MPIRNSLPTPTPYESPQAAYTVYRSILRALEGYIEPPHDPVPQIPGLPTAAQELLGQPHGVSVVTIGLRGFRNTLRQISRLDEEVSALINTEHHNALDRANDAHQIIIGAISVRLCDVAQVEVPDDFIRDYNLPLKIREFAH